MNTLNSLPVAIIGAGPVGLAAAAHLAVRNQPFIVFEAGKSVASNILSWKHIRVFSPWKYNIDRAARQLLSETKWLTPNDNSLPTGEELYYHYFKPLAELPSIQPYLHLESRVLSVGRKNIDKMKTLDRDRLPYAIQVLRNDHIEHYEARAVIDASGTWNSPNPIGSGGVYAIGELENSRNIFYGIPDILKHHAERYKNRKVAVVGSGHSSINVILELDKLKENYPATEIHWILRKKNVSEVYGGQEADALEARGALGTKVAQLIKEHRISVHTPFQIQHVVRKEDGKLTLSGFRDGTTLTLPGIDEIISNTGSRPDFSFLREVRLRIDPSLESVSEIAELIDPNIHSCGTVRPHGERELRQPDKDFYIVGSKSYGRAPTFLMATGYEQVRSVVAALDGDMEAARQVQLNLPETGVCRVQAANTACCGSVASRPNEPLIHAANSYE